MPASALPLKIPLGLLDYLRDVNVSILKTSDVLNGWAEGRIFAVSWPTIDPKLPQNHITVSLFEVAPEQRIGGTGDDVAFTISYALRSFRLRLEEGEPSIGSLWGAHRELMTQGKNTVLAWPRDSEEEQKVFVDHFIGFDEPVFSGIAGDREAEEAVFSVVARFRLARDAHARFANQGQ